MSCTANKQRFFVVSTIAVVASIAMATRLHAEILSFSSFQIEIPAGWEHSIESRPGYDWGHVARLRHPDRRGGLEFLAYDAPVAVGKDKLRNMTNVDASILMTWQQWGDYSGYQYDYVERGSFYRQWWLVNGRAMMFITYQNDPEFKDSDTEEIDKIVRSITAKTP